MRTAVSLIIAALAVAPAHAAEREVRAPLLTPEETRALASERKDVRGKLVLRYQRKPSPKGSMDGCGYSWFDDRLAKAGLPRPALLSRAPEWEGGSFAYEALNLVDGVRTIQDITDDLSATVGAVPAAEIAEFLKTLERLGVIEPAKG